MAEIKPVQRREDAGSKDSLRERGYGGNASRTKRSFSFTSGERKTGDRVYLHVPFEDKDEAKSLGVRWDPDMKQWYFVPGNPNWRRFSLWFDPPVRPARGRVRQVA